MATMTEQATHTIRVLLAEDDDNARHLLVDLLNTLGHSVVAEVATGREAYERAHELEPDVVLLDVHMPDGSGIEAAEKITRDHKGVAVVLFSGDQSVTLSDRDVEATSAIAFLPKPAPPRVLDSTIRLAAMRAKAPLSLKIALAQMRRGRSWSFEDCMRAEYRIVSRVAYGDDFYEGIRAVIVEKDHRPRWRPASLAEVTDAEVERHFAAIVDELTLP